MVSSRFPRSLEPVRGPMRESLVEHGVTSLAPGAKASRALWDRRIVPPGSLTPFSLYLLSNQPRREKADADPLPGGRASAVSGGVWVRERITYHRPLVLRGDIETTGITACAFSKKGRQYTTTRSETRDADGVLCVTSCTTGLVRYRPDPTLADAFEGLADDALALPGADRTWAANNPATRALRALSPGDRFTGPPVLVTLEMLRDRDGGRSANPIHTDPEAARAAGLDAPIAGGSHVLAFLQEILMEAWHPEVLLWGAAHDVRWRAPVRAGKTIELCAEVVRAEALEVELDLEARCDGERAMVGRLTIPLSD